MNVAVAVELGDGVGDIVGEGVEPICDGDVAIAVGEGVEVGEGAQ